MLRDSICLAAAIAAAPIVATAQPARGPTELADSFFRGLQAGPALKAYQDLWRGTLMDKKQADVENAANQTSAAMQYYGKVVGWEQVSEKTYAPSFLSRVYLVRMENGPLFFRLQFYRAAAGWMVYKLDFSDQADKLL